MKKIAKSRKEDADAHSPFNRLPDEIILQILSKLIDLKILCACYLVSRRFSSIVLQVDTISFTAPVSDPNIPDTNTVGDVDGGRFPGNLLRLFMKPLLLLRGMIVAPSRRLSSGIYPFISSSSGCAYNFLCNFIEVKSVCIKLTSSSLGATDNRELFKWKVNFDRKIDSFMFLSTSSIRDTDGNADGIEHMELTNDLFEQKFKIASKCFANVTVWHKLLLLIVRHLPKLEEVSITDSGRRGGLSLNGERLGKVKEWLRNLHSTSEFKSEINRIEVPVSASEGYIPVLNLPISGYVMKGIYFGVIKMTGLHVGNDSLMNSDDGFEDKEEAAYTEAVMEILEKHQDMMRTYTLPLE